MTVLSDFQKLNPDYQILTLDDPKFAQYGVVYHQYDQYLPTITKTMDLVEIPATGSGYVPSFKQLEALPEIQKMSRDVYAGMPTQAGQTVGHVDSFSAIEYHTCSELNIMLNDVIMVLGKRQTLDQTGEFNPNNDGDIFFVPKNTVIELYNSTLHYAPIEVTKGGFKVIVILEKGTNEDLPKGFVTSNKRIVKQGKFQVVHQSRTDKIAAGAVVGVTGKLITLKSL